MRSKCLPPQHRGIQLALMLALGFAVLGVAARGAELSERRAASRCEAASQAQKMAWHRQQSAAIELDSLTSLVRLFGTIADELAAGAGDDGGKRVTPMQCGVQRGIGNRPLS